MIASLRFLALLLAVFAIGCSRGDPNPQGQAAETEISLDDAVAIIQAYGEVLKTMRSNGDLVFGSANLPEPKARIRAALFRVLAAAETQKDADFLKAAVLRLAFFQDGVEGMAPLDASAADGRRYQEIVEAEVSELALAMAQKGYDSRIE